MMPVSSNSIITTAIRRKARHAGRPVIRNRALPTPLDCLPLSMVGLGSPTSSEQLMDRRDVRDRRPQRRGPSVDLKDRREPP